MRMNGINSINNIILFILQVPLILVLGTGHKKWEHIVDSISSQFGGRVKEGLMLLVLLIPITGHISTSSNRNIVRVFSGASAFTVWLMRKTDFPLEYSPSSFFDHQAEMFFQRLKYYLKNTATKRGHLGDCDFFDGHIIPLSGCKSHILQVSKIRWISRFRKGVAKKWQRRNEAPTKGCTKIYTECASIFNANAAHAAPCAPYKIRPFHNFPIAPVILGQLILPQILWNVRSKTMVVGPKMSSAHAGVSLPHFAPGKGTHRHAPGVF